MAITQPALARAMARDVVRAAPPEAGIKRIRDGRKHQADLLKKEKEEELKKAGATPTPGV